MYLDEGIVSEIRARFEDESEMELQDFLLVRLKLPFAFFVSVTYFIGLPCFLVYKSRL